MVEQSSSWNNLWVSMWFKEHSACQLVCCTPSEAELWDGPPSAAEGGRCVELDRILFSYKVIVLTDQSSNQWCTLPFFLKNNHVFILLLCWKGENCPWAKLLPNNTLTCKSNFTWKQKKLLSFLVHPLKIYILNDNLPQLTNICDGLRPKLRGKHFNACYLPVQTMLCHVFLGSDLFYCAI